jgi:hypothetical protein
MLRCVLARRKEKGYAQDWRFPARTAWVNVMKLAFVPLLQTQKELYAIARGGDRFRAHLRTLIDPRSRDLALPLPPLNPMGKDHVPAVLDALLGLDADSVGARAVAEVLPKLRSVPGEFKVALVLADDGGGWTHRCATEFSHRFETMPLLRRHWLIGLLWTSEKPSAEAVRAEVLATIYRAAYIEEQGEGRTLRERMAQEGYVMAEAGCRMPPLSAQETAAARAILAPLLETQDMRTAIECLFGDAAARALGFTPRGLADRAGLALALAH